MEYRRTYILISKIFQIFLSNIFFQLNIWLLLLYYFFRIRFLKTFFYLFQCKNSTPHPNTWPGNMICKNLNLKNMIDCVNLFLVDNLFGQLIFQYKHIIMIMTYLIIFDFRATCLKFKQIFCLSFDLLESRLILSCITCTLVSKD